MPANIVTVTGPPPSGAILVSPTGSGTAPATPADGDNPATAEMGALQMVWNPAEGGWDRLRTPTTWNVVEEIQAANQTTIWNPGAKSFRMLGGLVFISGSSARAVGSQTGIQLQDGGVTFWAIHPMIPGGAGTTMGLDVSVPISFPGNGYLSTAPGNLLSVNLGAAFTSGGVTVNVWGTQE